MPLNLDRREALTKLMQGSVAAAAGGYFYGGSFHVTPLLAGGQAPAAGATGVRLMRAPLGKGFIVHAGATAMELYHEHPHLQREEIVQPDDIRLQTRLVMRNHKEILDWLGLGWKNVVKLTCYQKRMNESREIQEVLASYFKDSKPAITAVEINGLSSPQARLEIDLWVVPDAPLTVRSTGTVEGMAEIFPRPEVNNRVAYALGVEVSSSLDLLFFSAVTPYPFDVDPWSPGEFKLPLDAKSQGKMATDNLDAVLSAADITPQHVLLGATYTAEPGAGVSFGARSGQWRAPGTALQVTDTGVPGVKSLRQLTAAAPRKTQVSGGPVPGIEPILPQSGMQLKNLAAAPAIRVSNAVDLVFFSGTTVYPTGIDPWNPGSFTAPDSVDAQEKMVIDSIDSALRGAGLTWQHVVLIHRVGETNAGNYLREKLGDWRPCRVSRVVSTGVPGAKVMYEITAVAPRT